MTEEDVIRAMEICIDEDGTCSRCPFNGVDRCIEKMEKAAFSLLIHYRKENARLMALVESAPSEGGTKYAELITELKEQQESYSAKKRKCRNNIPLFQYWLGREAEAERIISMLKRKDDENGR